MVGLHSGTHSKAVVVGAILMIAVADSFADAMGIHVHEESENEHSSKEIWTATLATLLAKFLMAGTFLAPVLLFRLDHAIIVSVIWGAIVLAVLSYKLARHQGIGPAKVMAEHLAIAGVVVALTHSLGDWVGNVFR